MCSIYSPVIPFIWHTFQLVSGKTHNSAWSCMFTPVFWGNAQYLSCAERGVVCSLARNSPHFENTDFLGVGDFILFQKWIFWILLFVVFLHFPRSVSIISNSFLNQEANFFGFTHQIPNSFKLIFPFVVGKTRSDMPNTLSANWLFAS